YIGFFFFFQAEDGIRDFHVTGVQTCALPISRRATGSSPGCGPGRAPPAAWPAAVRAPAPAVLRNSPGANRTAARRASRRGIRAEIGRASCRERVYKSGIAVS